MDTKEPRFRKNVTHRKRSMNKKLDRLIGQKAAEKRGKGWALTTFLREAWEANPFLAAGVLEGNFIAEDCLKSLPPIAT